jgi:hypothetical protein
LIHDHCGTRRRHQAVGGAEHHHEDDRGVRRQSRRDGTGGHRRGGSLPPGRRREDRHARIAADEALQTAVDGKQDQAVALDTLSAATAFFLSLSDDADPAAARATLDVEAAGTAAAAIAAHEAAPDPHPQYASAPGGDLGDLGSAAFLDVGTAADTVAAGNDTRFAVMPHDFTTNVGIGNATKDTEALLAWAAEITTTNVGSAFLAANVAQPPTFCWKRLWSSARPAALLPRGSSSATPISRR